MLSESIPGWETVPEPLRKREQGLETLFQRDSHSELRSPPENCTMPGNSIYYG